MSKQREPGPKDTVAGKRAYLEEHLVYERTMLAYTFERLHDAPPGPSWNMVYESFGIHARNLYQFLRNAEGARSDFRAHDYVQNLPTPAAFGNFNTDINAFVFHLSTGRVKRPKLKLQELQKLGGWLDKHWKAWVDALPEDYAGVLDPHPVCGPRVLEMGVTPLTACTAVTASTLTASSGPLGSDFTGNVGSSGGK